MDEFLGSTGDPVQEAAAQDVEEMLSNELMKVADAKGKASEIMVSQMQGANMPQRIVGSLDAAYKNMIAPNEMVVARLSPGDKILSMKNQRTVTDPRTNETVIVAPRPEYHAALTAAPIVDKNVVEAAYNRKNPRSSFDLQESLKTIQTLHGPELMSASSSLRTNISVAMSEEHEAIRQQAMRQSGYLEATTSVNLNRALDQQAGYRGVATEELIAAQELQSKALIDSQRIELSLVSTSARLAELTAAKEQLKTVEDWRMKQETNKEAQTEENKRQEAHRAEQALLRAEERGTLAEAAHHRKVAWEIEKTGLVAVDKKLHDIDRDIAKLAQAGYTADRADARVQLQYDLKAKATAEKAELLRRGVPEQQLENYRIVYGSSGDDMKDRQYIVENRTKDKRLAEVVNASDVTMYSMLASKDNAIREAALRLIDGYDKILNNQATSALDLKKGTPETDTTKAVRKILDLSASPDALLKYLTTSNVYTQEQALQYSRAHLTANAAGREAVVGQMIRDGVNVSVSALMKKNLTSDVRLWKSTETASGPFKDAIQKVRTTDGKVNIADAVDAFIIGDYKDQNGAVLDSDAKVAIINSALASAVQNGFRSSLFPALAAEALTNEIRGTISAKAMLSKINRFFSGVMPTTYGHYMRDRNEGGVSGPPLPAAPKNKGQVTPGTSDAPANPFYP